jgi:hypothetical protein
MDDCLEVVDQKAELRGWQSVTSLCQAYFSLEHVAFS